MPRQYNLSTIGFTRQAIYHYALSKKTTMPDLIKLHHFLWMRSGTVELTVLMNKPTYRRGGVDVIGTESPYMGVVAAYR